MRRLANSFGWKRTVTRLCFGFAAVATFSMTAQAQTYYYYLTSVPAALSPTNVSNVGPTYYVQNTMGNRVVWYRPAPQYYQPAYYPQTYMTPHLPQYYRPTYQAQTAQLPSNTQAPVVASAAPTAGIVPVASASLATPIVQPAIAATSTAPSTDASASKSESANTEVSDPYGFVSWLNATRAQYGLGAVGHDQNLTNWAAMNNNQQAARGMGHFVMGPARRQNAAMGAFANIGSMWMNSPAHRAALLDPTIRWIGIAGLGAYWTFNAN
jgi:uncharacterized protein YkwD